MGVGQNFTVMSYQYPPPPISDPDLKLPPQSIGNFQVPPGIPPDPALESPDCNSFSQDAIQQDPDQTGKIKRSSSTPNIRGQAAGDAALASSAEKRRNKLGYHRTSVACGHCRRRKIRCILAPGDFQNRCANCIRLKKECNFYPVDQPPQPESKGQRVPVGGKGLGRASSSASPTNQSGRSSKMQSGLSYPSMSMPSYLGSTELKNSKGDSFAHESRGLIYGPPNEYPPQPQHAAWLQSKIPPSTRPVADASGYWRINANESPLTPSFSMFPQHMTPSQQHNWPPTAVEPGSREEFNWTASQRSVSFGNIENLPQQPPYLQFTPSTSDSIPQEHFASRTSPPQPKSYMQGIPLDDSNPDPSSGPMNEPAPHVAGHRQLPSFSGAQDWQSFSQYGYVKASAAPGTEGFAGWFAHDPNILPSHQTIGDGMQTESYSQGGTYDSMYYGDAPQTERQL